MKKITLGLVGLLALTLIVGMIPSAIRAQTAKKSSAPTPMKSFKNTAASLEAIYKTLPRKDVPYRIYLNDSVIEVKPHDPEKEEAPAEAGGACVCGGWSDTEGGPYSHCGGCDCDPSGCGSCADCGSGGGTEKTQAE